VVRRPQQERQLVPLLQELLRVQLLLLQLMLRWVLSQRVPLW
jgi:hypothetical protein